MKKDVNRKPNHLIDQSFATKELITKRENDGSELSHDDFEKGVQLQFPNSPMKQPEI